MEIDIIHNILYRIWGNNISLHVNRNKEENVTKIIKFVEVIELGLDIRKKFAFDFSDSLYYTLGLVLVLPWQPLHLHICLLFCGLLLNRTSHNNICAFLCQLYSAKSYRCRTVLDRSSICLYATRFSHQCRNLLWFFDWWCHWNNTLSLLSLSAMLLSTLWNSARMALLSRQTWNTKIDNRTHLCCQWALLFSRNFDNTQIVMALEYILPIDQSLTLCIFGFSMFLSRSWRLYPFVIILLGGFLANMRRWGLVYYRLLPDHEYWNR